MYLTSLLLQNFRNYAHQELLFVAPKTILVGDNAQGKSNLLEAIEWLASLRSHRTSRDRDLIQQDTDYSQISATIERDSGPLELSVTLRQTGRRSLMVNSESVRRNVDFLGHLNAVEFSCLDMELVRGSPAERRDWLDRVLVQLEPIYAHLLQQYQKVLRQRNAFLKHALHQPLDTTQLTLWNQQLALAGTRLMRRRHRLIERLIPLAQQWHHCLSQSQEVLDIHYQSHVPIAVNTTAAILESFEQKFHDRAIAEQRQGTSLVGPHRDDVGLDINHTPARQYGSQGQQRTLVLALKLAELHLIEEVIGEAPLLLLDDVLAELDLRRQNQLLATIEHRFQTVITTTHLGNFTAPWLDTAQILTVRSGKIMTA